MIVSDMMLTVFTLVYNRAHTLNSTGDVRLLLSGCGEKEE